MSDLTDVDRAILRELADHDRPLLGGYLAVLVDVPGKAIGGRLSGLRRAGLVVGRRWAGQRTAWHLTSRGRREACDASPPQDVPTVNQ